MAIEQKINYAPFVTPGMKSLTTGQRAQSQFNTLADMAGLQLAKDIEIEERAQEAERLRLAASQREMLKKADKRARRKSNFSNILSLAGSGLGFAIAGPAGASIGGALGSGAGQLFGQQGGSVPSFVSSPTGKFNRSGYEQLVRDQEFLIDQEKAIRRAQKPTLGTLLQAGAQGYATGKTIGDFLSSEKFKEFTTKSGEFLRKQAGLPEQLRNINIPQDVNVERISFTPSFTKPQYNPFL